MSSPAQSSASGPLPRAVSRLRTQRGFPLSVVRATSDPGVVLAPDTLLVDEAPTSRLRSSSPS